MTDTTQAPDVIWVEPTMASDGVPLWEGSLEGVGSDQRDVWVFTFYGAEVSYVRKDLHDALQAKNNEQARQIAMLTARIADMEVPDDEPRAEWAGQ